MYSKVRKDQCRCLESKAYNTVRAVFPFIHMRPLPPRASRNYQHSCSRRKWISIVSTPALASVGNIFCDLILWLKRRLFDLLLRILCSD